MAAPASDPRPTDRFLQADDSDLIDACLAGRKDAWDELVDRYGRLVYSIARRYGLADADAEEVFQNVFLIAYQKLDTVRDRKRLSAWLIRTAHRECYRTAGRAGRTREAETHLAGSDNPADEDVATWEQRQLVRHALRRMGGRCEQLLVALFLATGQPNYQAIAKSLGMRIGSIGPTRARCFEKLEKILMEMGLKDEGPEQRSR